MQINRIFPLLLTQKIFICILEELLNNFSRSSDEQKIEMVCNELLLVTEAIRMATTPGHGKQLFEQTFLDFIHIRI